MASSGDKPKKRKKAAGQGKAAAKVAARATTPLAKTQRTGTGGERVGTSVFYSAASAQCSSASADAAAMRRDRPADDNAGLSSAQLGEIYRYLFLTRRLEEHLVALYRQNQVVGGVYRSLGQEATAVGCTYALSDDDIVQPLIRDLGAVLTHGVRPLAIMRQYTARATGPSGGRDLNTHFSAPQHGILGPTSMLGAMVPVLAGCLWAAKLQQHSKAGLLFIGDGGSSTGAFYEGLNFAVVKGLPLVAVIQANHYAYSTPTRQQLADGDLVRRARGMGCDVWHIDGNDVLACYETVREARQRALRGEGPAIIVADTYRRRGHAEHDNQDYVAPGVADAWATDNDPLTRFEGFLVPGYLAEANLHKIRQTVDAELDRARDTVLDEPQPTGDSVADGVFADGSSPWPAVHTWLGDRPQHRK